jgi:hypothetical protein
MTKYYCHFLIPNTFVLGSRGSSVSLTTDWTTGVRSPTEAEDFSSSLCVQTGSGAHPASYQMGTGGSFPGGEARPGRDSVPRLSMSRSFSSSPPCAFMVCSGTAELLLFSTLVIVPLTSQCTYTALPSYWVETGSLCHLAAKWKNVWDVLSHMFRQATVPQL